MTAWPQWVRLGRVLPVALTLVGCASGVGTFTPIGGARTAKPESAHIDVFKTGLPARPFERVAVLDAHSESQWFATPSFDQDVLPELLNQARAAGCDAIIEIRERQLDNPGNFETRGVHYSATGIAYK